jgi:DNA-binding transcriptional LysR family regulator
MFSQAIETYLAILKAGNLSAAAAELNLTQTTVSKRIKALESELGMTLIERGKGVRSMRLTPAGEEFAKLAEQWSLISREAKVLSTQGPRLSLTIGAVDSLNVFVLPQLYRNLHAQHPSLKIEIKTLHSDEMYEKIDRRQLDVAFSLRERSIANVDVQVFFSSPMVALSMETTSLKKKRKVHPNELAADDELYVPWGRHFDVWHDQWWDPLTPSRIKLDSGHLILSMLQTPRQWAIVPLWLAKAAMQQGPYMIREFLDSPPPYTCYKLTHKQPTSSTSRALDLLQIEYQKIFNLDARKLYRG